MSKSLGNSPDAMALLEKYGADGVRVGMLMCSPAGGDLIFKEELIEQGRNFCNKIWNALRLVKGWEVHDGENADNVHVINWFDNKFNQVLIGFEEQLSQYRLSEALKTGYSFIWQDFCSDYLEMIKPPYQKSIDSVTYTATIRFFENLMKMMHPIIPFITEEVYQQLMYRKSDDHIIVAEFPKANKNFSPKAIAKGETAKEIITSVRNIRSKNGLSPKIAFKAYSSAHKNKYEDFLNIILKKANLESLEFNKESVPNTTSFIVDGNEFFIDLGQEIDLSGEKDRLEAELKYNEGFKASIMKKLSNERFVSGAPEAVVAKEKQKLSDAENKIKMLQDSLAKLN